MMLRSVVLPAVRYGLAVCTIWLSAAQAQQPGTKAKPQKKTASVSPAVPNDDLFVWERPFYAVSIIPITRSVTCSFKQGLAASFQQRVSDKQKRDAPRVYYSTSVENESDTVSFV